MRSWAKPTADEIDRAVLRLSHRELVRYFFDRLENPEWIEPLRARGYFASPPDSVMDQSGKLLGWPPWPEGRYLARMATFSPELVVEILLAVPRTKNPHVHQDYFDAACRCAPRDATKLIQPILEMTADSEDVLIPERLCDLAEHLAKGSQFEAALTALQRLFGPLPGKRVASFPDEEMNRLPPRPVSRFEDWALERAISRLMGTLAPLMGIQILHLLCELLDQSVRLGTRNPAQVFPNDHLSIARPAIEDEPGHIVMGITDVLITGVRDCADRLIRDRVVSEADVLAEVEGKGWSVFRRIALHVLRCHPESELVAAHLAARTNFDDPSLRREYSVLAREHFGLLGTKERELIFSWIVAGPDLDEYGRRAQAWSGATPSEEERQRYTKKWQLERLGWLSPHLPDPLAGIYSELRNEIGEPEPAGAAVFPMSGWVGPTSPRTEEELHTLPVSELATFLKGWRPPDADFSPSPEGLGRTLSEVVGSDAKRFAEEASAFVGLDPTYVRALFGGLRDALRKKSSFPWSQVINLARWVVSQPREIEGRKPSGWDKDPHWGWCRGALAALLEAGFGEGEGAIPFSQRTEVWMVLQPLAEDPDPAPQDESTSSESSLDPATLSINTTRGQAMHAVIHYALWVRRNLEKLPGGTALLANGLKEMPEVEKVLERHLDLTVDGSLAIHSVYGQYFPYLHLLDPQWAEGALERIFPQVEGLRPYWAAAWKSYLVFCRPFNAMLSVLAEAYRFAVGRSAELQEAGMLPGEPVEHLAAHLMAFYWRGVLTADYPPGLLDDFWRLGSPDLRAKAIAYVGRNLHLEGLALDDEGLARLKQLWEGRLSAAKASGRAQDFASELAAFGWWVGFGRIDAEWALANLDAVLDLAADVDDDLRVMEQLARWAQAFPMQATSCAGKMVRLSRNPWGIHLWRDELTALLVNALGQPNPEVRLKARLLIDYLGQRGFVDFGRLLQNAEDSRPS
jgi:hypothetical protein